VLLALVEEGAEAGAEAEGDQILTPESQMFLGSECGNG
jgi:hypothetical protein